MTAPSSAVRRDLEPTHPCIRCGREGVPADAGLCDECNPLELAQPSATQMHGIAVFGIIAFIVVAAVLGRAFLAGSGPFSGSVGDVITAPDGLAVTLTVTNQGARDTATTCEIEESPSKPGRPSQVVQTPLIRAGETVTFTATVTKFGMQPVALAANCQGT